MNSLNLPYPCSSCVGKPCFDCFPEGSLRGRPVVPHMSHSIPMNCPAKVNAFQNLKIEEILRGLCPDDWERLFRLALRASPNGGAYPSLRSSGNEKAKPFESSWKAYAVASSWFCFRFWVAPSKEW